MIDPKLYDFYESAIEDFNPKQKYIAQSLIFDIDVEILKSNHSEQLNIRLIESGKIIDFEEYIKSKCNC
jgi:hypothetical protein